MRHRLRREPSAGHAVLAHHYQFARPHVALILRMQQVERARLRSKHKRVRLAVHPRNPPHRERPEPMRVPRRKDPVARHHHNRERPIHLRQRLRNAVHQRIAPRVRDQLNDDLRVRRRLEDRAIPLQPRLGVPQVHQVPIVRNRDQPHRRFHRDRLRIQQRRIPGRRVARVPDCNVPGQSRQHLVGEDLAHQPHTLDVVHIMPIRAGNPRRLLPAMLQRIQPPVRHPRGIRMTIHRHDPALLAQLIERRAVLFLNVYLFVIPQRNLFVIPQRNLFVIPQRSGGICFSHAAAIPACHSERSEESPHLLFTLARTHPNVRHSGPLLVQNLRICRGLCLAEGAWGFSPTKCADGFSGL